MAFPYKKMTEADFERIREITAPERVTVGADIPEDYFHDEMPEYETRRRYIDVDLEYAGWDLTDSVRTEVEVHGISTFLNSSIITELNLNFLSGSSTVSLYAA